MAKYEYVEYYLPLPVSEAHLPSERKDENVVKTRRFLLILVSALLFVCMACPFASWYVLKAVL
ncbi:MAG: hypothetical protein JXB47_03970 [Anaerolineae bacterium]|nr:hypothetical protein [Anaerolineae bacterium]